MKVYNYFDEERLSLSMKAYKLSNEVNSIFLTQKRFELTMNIKKRMKKLGIESLISFGLATPAIKHNTFRDVFFQSIYTSMYNFLNFAAGVIPITLVRKDEQYYNTKFNDKIAKRMKFVMEGSEGLPVGIQVCALFWKDELVVKIMKEIEKEIKEDFRCPF